MSEPLLRLDGQTAAVVDVQHPIAARTAVALASAGAHVSIVDSDPSVAEAVAKACAARGGRVHPVAPGHDLADALTAAGVAPGEMSAIIIGTGLPGSDAYTAAARLAATYRMAQQAGRLLARRGKGGAIVILATRSGAEPRPGDDAAVVEAGLVQLTRSMALEHGRGGLRVNALLAGMFEGADTASQPSPVPRVALGRPGRLDEIDGALLLLASPAGSYMTGCALAIDGGALLSLA